MRILILLCILFVSFHVCGQEKSVNLFQTKDATLRLDNGNKIIIRDFKGTPTVYFKNKTDSSNSKPFLFFQNGGNAVKHKYFFQIERQFEHTFLAHYGTVKTNEVSGGPGSDKINEEEGTWALYANDGSGIIGYWPDETYLYATPYDAAESKKIIAYWEAGSAGNIYFMYPIRQGVISPVVLNLSSDSLWLTITSRLNDSHKKARDFFRFEYEGNKINVYLTNLRGGNKPVIRLILNEQLEYLKL